MKKATVLTSLSPSGRPTYSCVRCSDRKVRCDRQSPCSACVQHNVQCVFRPPPPSRRKQKRVKDSSLKDKVKRYEAMLQKLGVDPNGLPNTSEVEQQGTISSSEVAITEDAFQVPTPASTASELLERSITTSQVLHDQGRYRLVDNSLWSRVVQEFHDPEEALEDSLSEASDERESDDGLDFVLGVARKPNSRYSHPPTERIHQLWQIFIENIDPVAKIVHVPSLQPAIQKATTDLGKVPRGFEALMFAIYAAAVMSLKDEECRQRLGEPREPLLSYYTSATKSTLSRAQFMGTNSIVVLQALVLHIFSTRHIYGPRTVWTLTGVAIRIAEGMGLHRDGTSLGVPPFEAEIRRRIWWQLKMHDFRAAELGGLPKFRGIDSDDNTCKPPANINDNELYPGMALPAISSTKLTDMIFCVFRTELASFSRRLGAKLRDQEKGSEQWDDIAARSDQRTKDEFIKEIEEILETKYLRYCDPSQPLQLLTMLTARSSLNITRFLAYHPRRWASQEQIPESEREYVWKVSVAQLEQHNIMQSDRRLHGFAWCAAYFLQWHIFIHVLDTLRAKPLRPDVEKTWRLIEATYENNPDMISNTKKPIHVAVGNLCLNTFKTYEAALMHQGRSIPREPDYITKLHQQREAAKARRRAREAGRMEARATASYKPSQVIEIRIGPDFSADEPQQNSSSQLIDLNQANESNPFWLTSDLDDGLYGTSGDIMNTDFMLAQDFGVDGTSQSIDWVQWDAWLSELNVTHANGSASSGFV